MEKEQNQDAKNQISEVEKNKDTEEISNKENLTNEVKDEEQVSNDSDETQTKLEF